MEIGITWENKLVYNKEIKVNKKAITTGLVIAGVGVAGIVIAMTLIPPTSTFAFTTSSVGSFTAADIGSTTYNVAEMTNKNGKIINDVILNSAQGKDLKMVWDYLISSYKNTKDLTDVMFFEGIPAFSKEVSSSISSVSSQLTPDTLRNVFDALIDRKATYSQSEVDLIKTLRDCMFN